MTIYPSRDETVLNACGALCAMTARLSRECCCNLYSTEENATTSYFTGEAFAGGTSDVVVRFLTDALFERIRTVSRTGARRVRFIGFIHSHPYSARRERADGGYEDGFSHADCIVARLTGAIYMVSPDGRIYALTREEYARERAAGETGKHASGQRCRDMRRQSADTAFFMPTKPQFARMILKRFLKCLFKRG